MASYDGSCVDSFLNGIAIEDTTEKVSDTAVQSAGQETAQACPALEDDRTIQKLVVSLWAPDAMPASTVAAGPIGSPEAMFPGTPHRGPAPFKASAVAPPGQLSGTRDGAASAWLRLGSGAEVGVPGLARSAAGTKLHAQAQRLHTPGTEGLQPMPRFLKGSGMHRAEQPHQQHRAPQFLKGGKPLRHSRQAPAIQDQEVSEEDDACEDDMVAEVAEERPRRRRKRIRRHEDGYNEAAQVKALECYILSAGGTVQPGWRAEGWYKSGVCRRTGEHYGHYRHTYYPPAGFKAITKELQKRSYSTQRDVCAAMGIDTSICEKSSHGELHNPLHEGHTDVEEQSEDVLISDTEEEEG